MPRSAIMITKSLRLNLKLVYQQTQRMMICPSKCRPLKRASTGTKRCILPTSPDRHAVCTRTCSCRLVTLLLVHYVPQTLIANKETDIFLEHRDPSRMGTGRIAGDMRREDDVRELPQGMALGQRLRIGDVQSGSGQSLAI